MEKINKIAKQFFEKHADEDDRFLMEQVNKIENSGIENEELIKKAMKLDI